MVDATGQSISYSYDSLNRLTGASSGGSPSHNLAAWSETYTYDGFGNLTDKTPTGPAPALHQTVDNRNHAGGAYDANGNLVSSPGGRYDYENRLMLGSGDLYSYGPDNQRVWKARNDGTEEIYFNDPMGRRLGVYKVVTNSNPSLYLNALNTNVYFGSRLMSNSAHSVQLDRLGSNVLASQGGIIHMVKTTRRS